MSGLWNPNYSDARSWYDPNDTDTTTIVATELTAMSDRIGTGVLSAGSTNPSEPIAVGDALMVDNVTQAGFLTTSDSFAVGISNGAASIGIMFICEVTSVSTFRTVLDYTATAGSVLLHRGSTDGSHTHSTRENDGTNLTQVNSSAGEVGVGKHIVTAQVVAGTSELKEMRIDGAVVTTGTDTITWDATDLDSVSYLATVNGSNRWAGYMGDMLMYNTEYTTEDAQIFEGYAAWKYGSDFVALLPSDHPYKTVAPHVESHITVARNKMMSIWRSNDVADVACVDRSTWNSTDQAVGHVFDLDSPGAVNRGRLPIVRAIFNADASEYVTDEGGMVSMSFDIEVIVGGVTGKTNQQLADSIMSAGEYEMRTRTDQYWRITDSSSNNYTKGPMMTTLLRTFTCELTWSADSVEL